MINYLKILNLFVYHFNFAVRANLDKITINIPKNIIILNILKVLHDEGLICGYGKQNTRIIIWFKKDETSNKNLIKKIQLLYKRNKETSLKKNTFKYTRRILLYSIPPQEKQMNPFLFKFSPLTANSLVKAGGIPFLEIFL